MGKAVTKFSFLLPQLILWEMLDHSLWLGTFILSFIMLGAFRIYNGRGKPGLGILHHLLVLVLALFVGFSALTTFSIFYLFLNCTIFSGLLYFIGDKDYLWRLSGWLPFAILVSYLGDFRESGQSGLIPLNFVALICIAAFSLVVYELFWELGLFFKEKVIELRK